MDRWKRKTQLILYNGARVLTEWKQIIATTASQPQKTPLKRVCRINLGVLWHEKTNLRIIQKSYSTRKVCESNYYNSCLELDYMHISIGFLKTLPEFVKKNMYMLKECSICQLGPGNSGQGSHNKRSTTGLVKVFVNYWSKSQLRWRIFNLIFSPNRYVPRPIFTYPFFIGGLNGRGKLLVVLLEFDIYSKSVWSQITAMFPYNLVIDSFREYSNVTYSINISKNFARRDPNTASYPK